MKHAAHSAEAYCLIPCLDVRFTLWTNKGKGNAMSYEYLLGWNTALSLALYMKPWTMEGINYEVRYR